MRNAMFGFELDDNGDLNFMTVQLESEVNNFKDYMEVFSALVQIAMDNVGYMPIITFPDEKPS